MDFEEKEDFVKKKLAPFCDLEQFSFMGQKHGNIWYETLGAGDPCYLLHGGPGMDHSAFRPFLDPLADSFELHFIDLRGCGKAKRLPKQEYHIEGMTEDLESLRQTRGHKKITLLGHSFGGMLALEYALKYPQYLSHLILICSAAKADFVRSLAKTVAKIPEGAKAQRAFMLSERGNEDFRELILRSLPLYFSQKYFEQARKIFLKMGMGAECYSMLIQNYMSTFSLYNKLSQIKVPTLVISAEEDLVIPPQFSLEIARLLPYAKYALVHESGHFPFIEKPKECIRLIKDWFHKT